LSEVWLLNFLQSLLLLIYHQYIAILYDILWLLAMPLTLHMPPVAV
jgi:hypothetical protein